MKKRVVAHMCAHMESVGEDLINQRYITNQVVCIMSYRVRLASRRHITEGYVVLPSKSFQGTQGLPLSHVEPILGHRGHMVEVRLFVPIYEIICHGHTHICL